MPIKKIYFLLKRIFPAFFFLALPPPPMFVFADSNNLSFFPQDFPELIFKNYSLFKGSIVV